MKHKFTLAAAILLITMLANWGCRERERKPVSAYEQEILMIRMEKDLAFKMPGTSPLPDEMISQFSGLPYFPVDEDFLVRARFELNPDPQPFEMMTTTERRPIYVLFGKVFFIFEDKEQSLEVYQNKELASDPEYEGHLFVPFRDATSGVESYGGGRYIDTRIPSDTTIVLDFNQAYNPYCAYNKKYSCPIPPAANTLSIAIKAGEKKPADH